MHIGYDKYPTKSSEIKGVRSYAVPLTADKEKPSCYLTSWWEYTDLWTSVHKRIHAICNVKAGRACCPKWLAGWLEERAVTVTLPGGSAKCLMIQSGQLNALDEARLDWWVQEVDGN